MSPWRGITRRWRLRDDDAPENASRRLLDRILIARGFHDPEAIDRFLNPSLLQLHDPSLIPDLDAAAERILRAVARREAIVIYGDYDVDGCTGAAILVRTIRAIDPEAPVDAYIPHRLDEGYGINAEAIEALAADGARLIVSVDCGISAVAEAPLAQRLGVDLIITDHHNPPASLDAMPRALAVVHPRRPDSRYPFGELCGAGVAFKLAWRLATMDRGSERVSEPMRETLMDLLALAALGTIADVVPLVDENRAIVRAGLARMRRTNVLGLTTLINESGLGSARVEEESVGFKLAPRMNASGRLGHAGETLELLLSDDPAACEAIARRLTRVNDERRALCERIEQEAIERIEHEGLARDDRRAIVMESPGWHPGVIGIVCSRIVERFGRPTILLQREGGVCRGSGRSIEGFNLHAALEACAASLETFGGHDMAAGLRLSAENLGAFTEAMVAVANERIAPDELTPMLTIDCRATLGELTPAVVTSLKSLGPFGAGSPSPLVLLEGLRVLRAPEPMGAGGRHLKIGVEQDAGGLTTQARMVAWGWGDRRREIAPGALIDAVVKPRLNEWRGRVSVDPEVVDIRVRDGSGSNPAVVAGAGLTSRSRCPS